MEMKGGPESWGAGRKAGVWVNVVVQVLVLVALLVMLNLLAHKFRKRFDLTSRRTYSLSNFADDVLRGLDRPVDVWLSSVDYDTSGDKSLPSAHRRTWELLQEMSRRTPQFRPHVITPQGGEAQELFAQHWKMGVQPATLYFLVSRDKDRTNKRAVELHQLFQGDAVSGHVVAYRGEPVIVQTVRDLIGSTRRIFYEVEGHQEILTGDRRMNVLKKFFELNEGVEFRRISLSAYRSVPVDCDVLMILGPTQPFQPQEMDLLREYLERGGNLLAAVAPKQRTGLEDLLRDYGVEVGDNLIHDFTDFRHPDQRWLLVGDFNVHEINRSMVNLRLEFPLFCTVDPISKRDPDWKIVPLARSGPSSWEEKGALGPASRPRKDGDERGGPLPLVVAVEKKASKPQDERHKNARILAWGSHLPFTDHALAPNGFVVPLQLEYITNNFRWLTDRELMWLKFDPTLVKPLVINAESFHKIEWVVWGGFPLFGVALGLLAWYIRRK